MKLIHRLHIKGIDIPLFIHRERRNNVRASFTSQGINLRIPKAIPGSEICKHVDWCKKWATKTIEKKPSIAYKYQKKNYTDGSIIALYDQSYSLEFHQHRFKSTIKGKIEGNKIIIYSPMLPLDDRNVKKIVVKIFNQHYLSKIKERVDFINELTIKKAYRDVSLKYLKTQWGNCAIDGRIKLSTRILFLPEKIQNAIILHELVHLIHMNHGRQFYELVYKYMPDYKIRDKWLKTNSGWMDF